MCAVLLSMAVAAAALAEDRGSTGESQAAPCPPPRPGEVVSGPCSPDPATPRDPSQIGVPPAPRPPPWPTLEDDEDDEGWLTLRHGRVEEELTLFVRRLDGFFGDPVHLEFGNEPRSWIRLRGEVRTGQDDAFDPAATILADLRLPSLDRILSRARIFVSGGDDDDPFQTGTEQDLVPRRFSRPSLRSTRGAAELRFDLFRSERTLVDVGGGARFRLPPPPYLRARVAHALPLRLGFVAHGNQTVFWERRSGFGESSRADLVRVFGPRTVARLWGIATLHERSRGLEWGAEGGLQQGIDARTGVYLAASMEGATRSNAGVDRYRVFTRLRRDIHHGWLFLELEPEVAWPVDALGERDRVLATIFRLEVQFVTSR